MNTTKHGFQSGLGRSFLIVFLFISLLLGLSGCGEFPQGSLPSSGTDSTELSSWQESSDITTPEISQTVEDLQHTEHFSKGSLVHIFHGEINKKGAAVGYHSESMEDTPGEVIEGTRNSPDEHGVYTAQVTVNGVKKSGNKGYSSFFPKDWTPQQVVDAINQAYDNRVFDSGNTYLGETEEGMLVQMYLTTQDKIISAFPIQET